MQRHRLRRGSLHPAARRSQRRLTPFFSSLLEAEPYVKEAYRAILDRPPDAEGLAAYAREIREGIHRDNVIDCLIASPEFDALYRREAEDGGSGQDVMPPKDNGG